ncbi:MAG: type IV toxin-antitoxin system AbiEi family antitoxin domain-containing protein [Acidimicrobiia bacterium]|nr:type IV toxin-antitoxin system AbiEi family antitoxin domain-containing protein [Acidimicrobiia bacterium]
MAVHHGVISRAEALSLGLSPSQISRRLTSHRWVRIGSGVYRSAAAPRTWFSEARAAALSLGGLVSHRSSAVVWEVDGFRPGLMEVVVPEWSGRQRSGIRVHRSRDFELADGRVVNGVPVTGLARTVLDVAAVVGRRRLEQTVDAVLRQKLLVWPDLADVLARHSEHGRTGCGRLRALLEHRYGDQAIPDSRFNRMVGQLLSDAGLPDPDYEHIIEHDGRFVARVDLAYPRHRVAIECDSVRYHLNLESFEADPRRKNALLLAGWRVLTFTWSDYSERSGVLVDTVRSALRDRPPRSSSENGR